MPKDIVICCDGTGNEIGTTISNVLKLYRVLEKSEQQRVYYQPGVGPSACRTPGGRFKQQRAAYWVLRPAPGLMRTRSPPIAFSGEIWQPGDRSGCSVQPGRLYRAVAGGLHSRDGLLPPDQIDLAAMPSLPTRSQFGQSESRCTPNSSGLQEAWHSADRPAAASIEIEFIGVWGYVASVIVATAGQFLFDLQTLRLHADQQQRQEIPAGDVDRRAPPMVRLNRWIDPQEYRSNPFDASTAIGQDIRQVWFAGVHGDVGGGYPEAESGLSNFRCCG